MKHTCLIVDDEPIAIRVIKNHLQHFSNIEVAAECSNAIEAIEFLGKQSVDLLFLDIQMPQLTGIDLLKNMPNPPKVIITTAYRDYAVDAFDLEVTDYLLKPFSLPRFTKAINRFYQQINENSKVTEKVSDTIIADYLFVKADKKIVKLSIADIVYVESLGDYVIIHTSIEKITTKERISNLYTKLPANQFIRIHRSYVVSIRNITSFLSGHVEVGKEKIPIGRNYRDTVDEFLLRNTKV